MVQKGILSICRKILIGKSFIISQFICTMQSIGIPEDILPTISRELLAFLWEKKTNIFFSKRLKKSNAKCLYRTLKREDFK